MSVLKINVHYIYPCARDFLLPFSENGYIAFDGEPDLSGISTDDLLKLATCNSDRNTKEFRNACALKYAQRMQNEADKIWLPSKLFAY